MDQAYLYQPASLLPDFLHGHCRVAQNEDPEIRKLGDKLKHLVSDTSLLQVECDQLAMPGQRGKARIAYRGAAEVEFHERVQPFQGDQFLIANLWCNRAEIHGMDAAALAPS